MQASSAMFISLDKGNGNITSASTSGTNIMSYSTVLLQLLDVLDGLCLEGAQLRSIDIGRTVRRLSENKIVSAAVAEKAAELCRKWKAQVMVIRVIFYTANGQWV